jgi:hypothetical protein
MNTKISLTLACALTLAACSSAQKAAEVAPSFVSTTKYSNLSCSSLRNEAARVQSNVAKLERSVDKSYNRDKSAEAVAWILFWPAAFAMKGNDGEANQLSEAKGDADAIKTAMLEKGCKI